MPRIPFKRNVSDRSGTFSSVGRSDRLVVFTRPSYTVRFYDTDLAFVHDTAFADYALRIAPELERLLAHAGILCGTILELGSGSGVTAEHLTRCGYEVVGIDASPAMVRLARARAPRASFRIGRIATARLPPCVAVLAIGEVLNYAPDATRQRPALADLFERVHRALSANGLFVFDFVESAKGRTYRRKTRSGDGWSITASAATDPGGRLLTRRIAVVRDVRGRPRTSAETHRVHLFDRPEVERALASAGFTVQFRRRLGPVRLLPGDVLAIATRAER